VIADDIRFRAIIGHSVPSADASALLRAWDYAGYDRMRLDVAKALGAAVVVFRDPSDAQDVLRELKGDTA
jgi:hypothetical protein